MKAVRIHQFGGPEVLKFDDVNPPPVGASHVLIDVKAAGVNPVDTYIRSGIYGPRPFPFTIGMDAAGIVTAVGSEVKSVKAGDRVYAYSGALGAYAELIVTDAASVYALPQRLSFAQGAAIGVPYATAYAALFDRGGAKPGEFVLVHGASGGVGTAAVQLARAHGMTVIGTAGTAEGRARVVQEGAHHALDHHAPDYLDQLMALTGGRGVDLVIEMLANVNLGKDLKIIAKFGRVIVVGNRGSVEINPRDAMIKFGDIRMMSLVAFSADDLRRIHAGLRGFFETTSAMPVVGKELPLADAAKAHEAVLAPGAHGKIVLVPKP